MNWIAANWHLVFAGIGSTIVGAYIKHLFAIKRDASNPKKDALSGPSITINNQNSIGSHATSTALTGSPATQKASKDYRILFVDDDTKFKVVKIIITAGWPNVRIIKDISHLNSPDVVDTDIFFIDIQGVGKAMQFTDEGLGLAFAIKKKYPQKKVVIYSAQTTGERFHEALRNADSSLPKNAEPFEFIQLVERWTQQQQ